MDSLDSFAARLKDRAWRLANLYWIMDKSGARVRFVPNWAQLELFESLGRRNVDLKVRQLGITTGYCILWLDACLFSDNLRVGIVAHTKEDAKIIVLREAGWSVELSAACSGVAGHMGSSAIGVLEGAVTAALRSLGQRG
jgi:hypothetical protein